MTFPFTNSLKGDGAGGLGGSLENTDVLGGSLVAAVALGAAGGIVVATAGGGVGVGAGGAGAAAAAVLSNR